MLDLEHILHFLPPISADLFVDTIFTLVNPTETFSRSFKVYQDTLNERMLVYDESLLRSGLYGYDPLLPIDLFFVI